MKTYIVLLCAIFAVSALGEQRIPIPNAPEGVLVLNANPKVSVEAFYDLACPDSTTSQRGLNTIWSQLADKINFTVQLFPLPYHYNSYVLNQGGKFFLDTHTPEQFMDFVNWVFDNQTKYFNSGTTDMTIPQVKAEFAKDISGQFDVSYDEFLAALNNRAYDLELRTAWKYGCSRTVTGTPLFYLNGVLIDGADAFSGEDWISFLGQYVDFSDSESTVESLSFMDMLFGEAQ